MLNRLPSDNWFLGWVVVTDKEDRTLGCSVSFFHKIIPLVTMELWFIDITVGWIGE